MIIIGLAPAAHGGNRTGRVFTGDPSGDALFAALYELGLASQPLATHRGDGMELYGVRISLPVHCAPPGNRPTVTERDACQPWLNREPELLASTLRAVVALGAFGWQAALRCLAHAGWRVPRPRPASAMAPRRCSPLTTVSEGPIWRGGYHPSQRNMFTRTLTPAMLDVLRRGATLAGLPDIPDIPTVAAPAAELRAPLGGAPARAHPRRARYVAPKKPARLASGHAVKPAGPGDPYHLGTV